MGLKTLYKSKAFDAGSQLWIVPEPEHSVMALRVDWYLNFQLARARYHKTREISPELRNVLIQQDWPEFAYEQGKDAPLLVAAAGYFPTEMVVQVPLTKSFKMWVKGIHATWKNLGCPSIRIFLPEGRTIEDFKAEWTDSTTPYDLSVVPS